MTDTEDTIDEVSPEPAEDPEGLAGPEDLEDGLDLPEEIRVLCVDDDEDFLEMTATYLERNAEEFTVLTATSPSEGRDVLSEADVDCVVSDYQMPGENGIEFLRSVREIHPALPFILFTGKGSEEVASDAFAAGSTDYLQKETGPDQYTVLANRVAEAVLSYRARRTLRERERRFRKLIEGSVDVIVILGGDGTFEYVSPSARRVFGYDLEDLVGMNAYELVHPDDIDGVMEKFGNALEDPTYAPAVEYRYQHADGSWRWAQAHGRNYLDDPDVGGFVVNVHDVTERKQLERRYQTLFEKSPAATTVLDESGTIQWVSQSIERIYGKGPEAMEGQPAIEFVHPDDRETVLERFQKALADEDPQGVEYEYRIRNADGDVRWIQATTRNLLDDPVIEGIVLNATDVTERKEREQAYRQELEFVETTLNAFEDAVYVFDTDGEAIRWNDTAREVVGYTDEELAGMHALEFVAEEEHEAVEASIQQVLEEGTAHAEITLVTKTGERIPYELRGARLETPAGEVRGFCGVGRDVTDQRARERELERHNERLEEFRDLIAHDLRNPLGVAKGFLEQARETGDLEHLERVAGALDRIETLSGDLLTLAESGPRDVEPTPLDLAGTARAAWRTVQTADTGLTVEGTATLRADRSQFVQLLENLFRNAVEHGSTSSGSQAGQDAVEDGSEVTVTVGVTADGFYVADDGVGIDAADEDQVFERDYTTAEGGSGLGLSIVQSIAHAHGWDVTATTSDEGGARFEFTGIDFDE